MTPTDLVEQLLSEGPNAVAAVVAHAEKFLGDVITDETTDDEAREECWTLCIDKANDMLGVGNEARRVASQACAELGYPPKGYRAPRAKPTQPVWPPRAAGSPAPETPPVKPTGVHRPTYDPRRQ
jgi:hypothetical protein